MVVFEQGRKVTSSPFQLQQPSDTVFPDSPHMRKLYGDSLRKEAGFVKVIKDVATKNARRLESRAGQHAPRIKRVAKEVKITFDKAIEDTAEAVEEFLAKCKRL